ncbi:MAG: NTPase [Candidatus Hydrothermarchaeales archaeon]
MKILITGKPGCGKTTLCKKIIEALEDWEVGGIISAEIKEEGTRIGFNIMDLKTGEEGTLAHILGSGPRVGKYRVNLQDLNVIGAGAIERAAHSCDLVVIDEIGPMELHSDAFIRAVRQAFEAPVNVLATIHYRSRHPFVEELKHRRDVRLYEIHEGNRESVLKEILELLHP